MKNLYFATVALLCSATAFATTLNITTPSDGATVSTSMRVTASTDNGTAIYAYLDSNLAYQARGQQLDTTLNVSAGQHHLVLVTWDPTGKSYTAERYVTAQTTAPTPTPTSSSGITITSPTNGATVSSPVHFALTAANAQTIHIYVDDQLLYNVHATQVDTSLAMSVGNHYVVVQSWDAAGTLSRVTENITVSATATPTPTPTPTPTSGITVSSPANGATVSSPVQFSASAANGVAMHIYVDDQLAYQVSASSLNTSLAMSSGGHSVVVQSWDKSGNVTKSSLKITVSGGSTGTGGTSSGPSIPSNATVYKDIDQMSGWENCGACAGENGSGPVVPYSATQGRSSPSIDGSSMQFWLGGSTPWGAALWWKQVTPLDSAKHYVYDLYFYYQDKYAPQALEFDMNVTANGKRYIFGTQCDIGSTQGWDTWNNPGHYWEHSGASCPAPPVNTWNHLILEFQRNDDGSMTFIAVTLNGNRKALNVVTWPTYQDGHELNVAFQMDGNYQETNYSVWLDKVQLSAW